MDLLQHNVPTKHHIPLPKPHHQSAGSLSYPKTNQSTITPKMQLQPQFSNSSHLQFMAHRGIRLHPIYVEYSISCIKAFMTSLHSTGTLSQLAWIALTWAQHVASTSVTILEDTSTQLLNLAPMQWISNLCKILNKIITTVEFSRSR